MCRLNKIVVCTVGGMRSYQRRVRGSLCAGRPFPGWNLPDKAGEVDRESEAGRKSRSLAAFGMTRQKRKARSRQGRGRFLVPLSATSTARSGCAANRRARYVVPLHRQFRWRRRLQVSVAREPASRAKRGGEKGGLTNEAR